MNLFRKIIDNSPALRCSKSEAIGNITQKSFLGDVGFGDCAMKIEYEFDDKKGSKIKGNFKGTESSFFSLKQGDQILIRYLDHDSKINAPKDSLSIVCPINKK
ncbi:MAG: hypothetical protein V4507_09685 [Verrucomicrobiota bacterium]